MSNSMTTILLLSEEKEYMDALAERLCEKHDWSIIVTNMLDSHAEEADLIVAEEEWISQMASKEGLLNKTIFLLEERLEEEDEFCGVFPRTVGKDEGFRKIEGQICDALDALSVGERAVRRKIPPMVALGAWNGDEERGYRLAGELAGKMKGTVLFLGLERLEERRDNEENARMSLEDLLYYVLDRLELEGVCREDPIRAAMEFRGGVCRLPDSLGMNPLWELERAQWDRFLPLLCSASRASAVLLWTGREELTRCGRLEGRIRCCAYLRPERQERGWNRLRTWMEAEGRRTVGTEIHLAESWSELFRVVMEFGENVV